MSGNAKAIVPAHRNLFRLEIDGIPVAMFQKCKLGKIKVGRMKMYGGGQTHAVWYPDGKVEFEPMETESVVPIDGEGKKILFEMLQRVVDWKNGKAGHPREIKKQASLIQLGPDELPVRNTKIVGLFMMDFDDGELDESATEESAISIDKATWSYDYRDMEAKDLTGYQTT